MICCIDNEQRERISIYQMVWITISVYISLETSDLFGSITRFDHFSRWETSYTGPRVGCRSRWTLKLSTTKRYINL